MRGFQYFEPETLSAACSLLAKYKGEAKVIAGGQSLLSMLKNRLLAPDYVVNIKGLSGLEYIKERPSGIAVGALTIHRAIETSPVVGARYPLLVEMEHRLAAVQVRNWGTIGGNLCHADPAADPPPCLLALNAIVKLKSRSGTRSLPLEQFFKDYLESVLAPDELMVEIFIPNLPARAGTAFIKESVRANDMAVASAAAVVIPNGKGAKEVRIGLGAAGPTPLRARKAEKTLVGRCLEDAAIEEAAAIAAEEASPTTDMHGSDSFKRQLLQVVVRNALKEAGQRAQVGRAR
ncbi:MAG: xanthine dehydrogenase family protein subunit M [Chloroflexi bacterium]|nr:xanthine dehydrogenase family protein subunit M [Chloroflexota bacterium]